MLTIPFPKKKRPVDSVEPQGAKYPAADLGMPAPRVSGPDILSYPTAESVLEFPAPQASAPPPRPAFDIKPDIAAPTRPAYNIAPDTFEPAQPGRAQAEGEGISSLVPAPKWYAPQAEEGTIERYQQDLSELNNVPRLKEKSFWKRLLMGVGRGVSNWQAAGAPGGLAGLIGSALGGGATHAFAPKIDRDFRVDMDRQQLQRKLGEAMAVQSANFKLAQERADAQKKGYDAEGSRLGNIKTQGQIVAQPYELSALQVETINKAIAPLLETYGKDKKIDETEAANLSAISGRPFSPQVWQEYIEKEFNGKTFTRSEFDPRFAVNQTVPVKPDEVPYPIQIGDAPPLPLKPKDAAPTLGRIAEGNADRSHDASKFNISEERRRDEFAKEMELKGQQFALDIAKFNVNQQGVYQGNAQTWAKDTAKAQSAIKNNAPLIPVYDQQIQEAQAYLNSDQAKRDANTSPQLVAQANAKLRNAQINKAKAQGEIDAANYFIQNIVPPPPPQQIQMPAPATKSKTSAKPQKDPLGIF